MSIKFLKIKLKSLAAEAKIIRREELRLNCSPSLGEDIAARNTSERTALYVHRIITVRSECRATHLAYGYLRGRAYHQLEASCRERPDWARVARMVYRYGKTGRKEAELIEVLRDWATRDAGFKVAA
jgi:hypothetical protein